MCVEEGESYPDIYDAEDSEGSIFFPFHCPELGRVQRCVRDVTGEIEVICIMIRHCNRLEVRPTP